MKEKHTITHHNPLNTAAFKSIYYIYLYSFSGLSGFSGLTGFSGLSGLLYNLYEIKDKYIATKEPNPTKPFKPTKEGLL